MVGAEPTSVLVAEPRAHYPNGHFPNRCAELATAYAELGYRVELLTSLGWARDQTYPTPPFTVRRWRRWARRLRRKYHDPWLFTVLLAIEVRACVQTMVPRPDVVVVLAWDEIPTLLAAIVPLHERWLVNQFRRSTALPRSGLVDEVARRRERRRRADGGAVRIVVAHERLRATWVDVAPFLDPVVAPATGVRRAEPIPDARARLGLPSTAKLALLFGEGTLKRRDVVLDAFADLDDWTLVMGGPVADGVVPGPGMATFPGVVDDDTRDRLFAAADLVVLSFAPDYRNESGTLMDAIAAGTPVVCCDDATVAEAVVARFRLGPLFRAGDARSLADAVRAAPAMIDPGDLAAARREHSNRSVARRQLLVMGVVAL
ncbi:MAG TPA: glycosyltransferase [Acidimicrobiia bacterium]|jgi:glycosyltransferase involved in cell wall biosynthesis